MSESTVQLNCKICDSSEMEVPMLQARYGGESFWVCSGCIPVLIHKPEQLVTTLDGAD